MQNLAETIYILHKSCQPYLFCLFLLTLTSYRTPESAPPGEGRGGAIGGGGEPLRYGFTGKGRNTLSPWVNSGYTYSLLQLNLGSNPNSRLEVVSLLNIPSQAHEMYYYNTGSCLVKYNPKVYFGTLLDVAPRWIMDYSHGSENDPISGWPQAFQGGQKGEANI